jgi:hypothetical protein
MKKFEIALLCAGMTMLGVLLHKMDFAMVCGSISMVGAGFLLIFFQEIVAFVFNSLGWQYSFSRQTAAKIPFRDILKIRVAGDGVN